MNNDFFVTREAIRQWFSLVTSSLVKIIAESPHSWQKTLFAVTHALFFTSPWHRFLMFSIESSSKKTYQMTQTSPKSTKGLKKKIDFGESMELAALSDAILDFWKNAQSWTKFPYRALFVTHKILQVKPGCSNLSIFLLSFSWRFSLMSETKMLHNFNITMIFAFYGSKCIPLKPGSGKT